MLYLSEGRFNRSHFYCQPEKYLYTSINCLTQAVSFTDRPQDLKSELSKIVDSASKVGLSLKRVNKVIERKCKLNQM